MHSQTRRSFLRSAAAAGVGAGAVGAIGAIGAVGSARAWHDGVPGNVTIEYDEPTLERYRPRLVMPTASRQKHLGTFGWIASSPDYDESVAVYWNKYTHQEGWLGNLDGHWSDHEPTYTFYDSSTGEVTRVIASVYHWLKGDVRAEQAPMWDETHPHVAVVEPWHQYTAPSPAASGRFFEVKNLTGVFDTWLANGLEESLYRGAVTTPWTMRNRPHWWKNTLAGLSLNAEIVRAARAVGYDQVGNLEA